MGIKERKEREKERRRQQIIIAAKRIFSAKGFNKATMEDIAKEAEISPGTIYIYFKNKDELYASLSIRILQHLNIRLEHVKNQNNVNVEQRIATLKDALYDIYNFDPLILINLFHLQSSESLKNLSFGLLSEIKRLSQDSLKIMADIFSEGISNGVFIKTNPNALADIFWALFSGVILWEESKKIIDNKKDFLKPTLDIAFDIFRQGITK
ncbi:MAG: TetR/AcrR family transcriptional regulator [Deltaproteobacteria bacterium]|jgi:AcrR family transcriptional regulator|nr:TetR/AcrR family transcriptional regulator [Deltaproteobacteria bacterium]